MAMIYSITNSILESQAFFYGPDRPTTHPKVKKIPCSQ